MKVKVYAPQNPDPVLGEYFQHEQECPLCHQPQGGHLKPHPDCKIGNELHLRSKLRSIEMQKEILARIQDHEKES